MDTHSRLLAAGLHCRTCSIQPLFTAVSCSPLPPPGASGFAVVSLLESMCFVVGDLWHGKQHRNVNKHAYTNVYMCVNILALVCVMPACRIDTVLREHDYLDRYRISLQVHDSNWVPSSTSVRGC